MAKKDDAAAAAAAKSKQEKMMAAQAKKSERFKARAVKIMTRALSVLAIVESLSDRRRFVYDPAQSKKIVEALRSAADRIEKRFAAGTDSTPKGFEL